MLSFVRCISVMSTTPFEIVVAPIPLIGILVFVRCNCIRCAHDSLIKLICAPESQKPRIGNDSNSLRNCFVARNVPRHAGMLDVMQLCIASDVDVVIIGVSASSARAEAGVAVVINCYWASSLTLDRVRLRRIWFTFLDDFACGHINELWWPVL